MSSMCEPVKIESEAYNQWGNTNGQDAEQDETDWGYE